MILCSCTGVSEDKYINWVLEGSPMYLEDNETINPIFFCGKSCGVCWFELDNIKESLNV
jgi:hypothetical protein